MIRTQRGRWGVLSPCYPWSVDTEYKNYPSLLNYLADDTTLRPTKLLNKRININKSKIVSGLKILLRDYPRYKAYLHCSPKDLEYVNPLHPEFAKLFTETILEAREAIRKFRIKGQEVLDKRNKFEMLGAKIIGDQAVFDYDARQDINNIVYGISNEESLERLKYVGNMIQSYIYIFDKMPEFLMSHEENPNVFYALRRHHKEQIAKILCTVNVKDWKPLDKNTISSLIYKINDKIGSLWPFIVFPKALHPGIKKGDGLSELIQMLKYQIEYETIFKKEITCRLQMLDYSFRPSHKDILKEELAKIDGTESSDDETISVEVLEIEKSEDLQFKSTDSFADKWIIWSEDGEQDNQTIPDFATLFLESTEKSDSVAEQLDTVQQPVQQPEQPVAQVQSEQQPVKMTTANPVIPDPHNFRATQLQTFNQPVQPVQQPTTFNQPVQPVQQPATNQPVQQPATINQPVQQPAKPKVPWDQRFKKLTQVGHVIEPHNPLSPFGKNPVFWKGVKYENMLAAIYNQCMQELLPDGVQYKNSANKSRNHILAYNKKEECIIWFKDKGIEMLKEFLTTDQYKLKKRQMSMDNLGQLTYLYSRRKQQDVLLEPWVGAIKVEAGLPYLTLMIAGWNTAYQVQLE